MILRRHHVIEVVTVGAVLLIIGLALGVIFTSRLEITCTKAEDNLTICDSVVALITGTPVGWQYHMEGVRGAYVDESCNSESCDYRLVLNGMDGEQYLHVGFFFTLDSATAAAEEIAQYSRSPQEREPLRRTCTDALMVWFLMPCVSGPFVLLGAIFVAGALADLRAGLAQMRAKKPLQ